MSFRVGIGFDSHPLAAGRRLVLGGVAVPHPSGLAGHSDGDVLTHAIMDALLGAAALGDKGQHFPSSDARYEDIASLRLLRQVAALLDGAGWRVSNVDATILAQNPRLGPFIPQMREQIAETLAVSVPQISVKATTTDHLGFTGREEGLAAIAIAALIPAGGAAEG